MTFEERILAVIRDRMEERGISQSELARKIGLTRQKVWGMFNKRRPMYAADLIRACLFLKLEMEAFRE